MLSNVVQVLCSSIAYMLALKRGNISADWCTTFFGYWSTFQLKSQCTINQNHNAPTTIKTQHNEFEMDWKLDHNFISVIICTRYYGNPFLESSASSRMLSSLSSCQCKCPNFFTPLDEKLHSWYPNTVLPDCAIQRLCNPKPQFLCNPILM